MYIASPDIKPLSLDEAIAAKDSLPAYMQPAIGFLQEWQNGQDTWTIKTSGSTGIPKDFVLYRNLMIQSARLTAETFGIQPGETLLCCLVMNYIAGLMMAVRAVVLQCNLYLVSPTADPLKDIPEGIHFDMVSLVPMQVNAIFNHSSTKIPLLNAMKAILIGGGPADDALIAKVQEIKAPVYHTFSMTETYTHLAVRRLNGAYASVFYKPLAGVNIRTDARQCLIISSPITLGKELITNDVVEIQQDGSFKWLGRFDHIINSGGIKINAENIEAATKTAMTALGIPFSELFAAGIPDAALGQKLVLYIEGNPLTDIHLAQLKQTLETNLPKYHTPKHYYFIPAFTRTHTGKINRNETMSQNNEKRGF